MIFNVQRVAVCTLCAVLVSCAVPAFAQDDANQTQMPLSEQLKSIIYAEGIAEAESWFKDNWAESKGRYTVDPEALIALMAEYLNAGDSDAAQAVGEITATVMQDALAGDMQVDTPEMLEELNAQQQADAKQRAAIELREPD